MNRNVSCAFTWREIRRDRLVLDKYTCHRVKSDHIGRVKHVALAACVCLFQDTFVVVTIAGLESNKEGKMHFQIVSDTINFIINIKCNMMRGISHFNLHKNINVTFFMNMVIYSNNYSRHNFPQLCFLLVFVQPYISLSKCLFFYDKWQIIKCITIGM